MSGVGVVSSEEVKGQRMLTTLSRRFSRDVRKSLSPLLVTRFSSSCASTELPWSEILPYRSVRIDLHTAWNNGWTPPPPPTDDDSFSSLLSSHLQQWKREGRSGVWLHLPLPLIHLTNQAIDTGFSLHHTAIDKQSLILSAWLEDSPSRLPPFASHQVGVSGVVWREDTNEMLVVQDKYKFVNWKFPGGLAEPSEDIGDAAVREVLEETGVKTEFRSIIAFRQHHHMPHAFGCSDLYFICRLHPLTFDLIPCEREVVKCEWRNVQELATTQESTLLTRRISQLIIENSRDDFRAVDIAMEEWPSIYSGQNYKLFLRTSSDTSDTY